LRLARATYVLGTAAAATGIMDLVYGAFDPAEQPIQAWGDNVPGSHGFAYLVGLALVVGGIAILDARTRRLGATILAGVYSIFAVFWLPRLIVAPEILGQFPGVYIGILAGISLGVIVICAACATLGRVPRAIPVLFGVCVILFGLQHLLNLHSPNNTSMVPLWMPFGQVFWVVLTGIAFVLAGLGIITRVEDVLAARMLAIMLLVFSAVTLAPSLLAAPHQEASWGANLYNIVAAASAWVLADAIGMEKGNRGGA
jgi:uncharacterized membrane protein